MKSRGWFKCTTLRCSPLVCGVSHPCGVPRGQNHTGWNRCDSEALASSQKKTVLVFFKPGSAGNATKYHNAGPDSPDGSGMRPETLREHVPTRTTIDFSETLCWHLQSHRRYRNLQKLVRSTLGLTDVYNLLPARVVGQKSVAVMQHELQCLLKFRAVNREDGWQHTFSPRVSLSEHPLHHFS